MTYNEGKTAVILINWNGAEDTIEALKSFNYELQSEHIFVLDNDSADDSLKKIEFFLIESKIQYSKYQEADQNNLELKEGIRFYLLSGLKNRGFAGGNNFAIKLIWDQADFNYFWLLNNDTVILKNSLQELITCLRSDEILGFAGSVIMDYSDRNLIQCCGGKIYKYFGVAKMICKNQTINQIRDEKTVQAAYQSGASLLVKREVIEKIGLLDETFFMYSEESDWQLRAKRVGFKNELANKSIVYHKGSVSTKNRRDLFYYYYNRSSMILTRKHFNLVTKFTVPISLTVITFIRSFRSLKNFIAGIRGIVDGLFTQIK